MTGRGTAAHARSMRTILRGFAPEIRELLQMAHDQGYRVVPRLNSHFKVTTPANVKPVQVVFGPGTPSDRRSAKNVRSALRRIGVDIPHT